MGKEQKRAEAKDFLTELVEEFAASKVDIDSVPKLSESSIEGLYGFAYKFYQNGKYQDAVNFFRFLTLIDSKSKRNWLGLGASFKLLQAYEKALNAYHVATLLDKTDPHPFVHSAECYFSLNQVSRALEYLALAEELVQKQKKFRNLLPQLLLLREGWEMRHVEEKAS